MDFNLTNLSISELSDIRYILCVANIHSAFSTEMGLSSTLRKVVKQIDLVLDNYSYDEIMEDRGKRM